MVVPAVWFRECVSQDRDAMLAPPFRPKIVWVSTRFEIVGAYKFATTCLMIRAVIRSTAAGVKGNP